MFMIDIVVLQCLFNDMHCQLTLAGLPKMKMLMLLDFLIVCITVSCVAEDSCPKACTCDSKTQMVDCRFFWNKLPDLPRTTTQLTISGTYLGELTSPISCSGYENLTVLQLPFNRITSISKDALKCMPALRSFMASNNKISDLRGGTFDRLWYLNQIILNQNSLSATVLPKLCAITNLQMLYLLDNQMVIYNNSLTCLGLLPSLSDISLSYNTFSGSTAEILKPLKNVTNSISLKKCNISSLEENTFDGFRVQVLDLSDNSIRHIAKNTFNKVSRLNELHLVRTRLSEAAWFTRLSPSITLVDLTGNQLESPPSVPEHFSVLNISLNKFHTLRTGSFVNLTSLLTLNLQGCEIGHLERNAFYQLPKLESLIISSNRINSFADMISYFMYNTGFPLKNIDMSENPLYTLEGPSVELGINSLETLWLNNAEINRILPGAFDMFINLKKLWLKLNHIQHLSPSIFQELKHLEKLELSYNSLLEFDAELSGLQYSSIIALNLLGNDLQRVSVCNISTLKTISIGRNEIITVSSTGFFMQGLTSLRELDLLENHIAEIDAEICEQFSNLDYFDVSTMSNSRSPYLDFPKCIPYMKALTKLKLTGNPIGYMNAGRQKEIWKSSHQLINMFLDKCSIKSLARNMFSSLPNLLTLDLSSNHIRSLEPTAFRNVSRLETLELDDNLISYVNWESLIYLKQLRFLSLSQNPLVCTCDVLIILQAIRSPSMALSMLNQGELICSSPDAVQGSKVGNLALSLETCEGSLAEVSGFALLFPLGILMFYIVARQWRYRWHIRYTMFLARAGVGRYAEQCDDHKYLFDAFLAYSEKDLKWVIDQLLKNMDKEFIGEEGLNMCLHHRDWLAGVEITENIVRSIAASRRTIIILSKEFAASYWCRFELAMAHMKLEADIDKKGRLLVILLEKIPDELLCPHIVHILSTKTYLAWPEDEALQGHFWKALRKSMKKELLYK